MTMNSESTSFDSCSPSEWLLYLRDPDSIAPQQIPVSQIGVEQTLLLSPLDLAYPYEPLQETQQNAQPADFDERQTWHEIPQNPYNRSHWDYTPSKDTVFQVDGFPGINMGAALRGEFTTLKGRDDLVMQDVDKTAFQCRFQFSGCPVKSYQISTLYWNEDRDPVPRSKLAYDVAKKLDKYLDLIAGSNITDPSTGERWRVGEGFVHLDNIFLRKLESVSKGSYQPMFYVVVPSM